MKNCHTPMLAAVLVLAAQAAIAGEAPVASNCAPRLTPQDQRLYARAHDGAAALRKYMFVRRGIFQLDIHETAVWADSIDRAREACERNAARSQPASPGQARLAEAPPSEGARQE